MTPGIYQDLEEAVYRADPALNQSILKKIEDCPQRARWELLNPTEPTPAMALGSLTHSATMEPSLFEVNWIARPAGMERRSNKGKAAWAAFEEEHRGLGIVSQADWDTACAIRDAVWSHPLAASILSSRKMTEASIFWVDQETELAMKGRVDALCEGIDNRTLVVDLKTCRDASPKAMSTQSARLGYAFQGACYLSGLDHLAPQERRWVMIAVESKPPHLVACYEFDWESFDAGRRAYRSALAKWKECVESEYWPGFPAEIQTLELPRWALPESEEEIF